MNRRAPLFLLGLLASIGPARSAWADGGSLAEALFREGRAAMRAGDYAAACPKLAESERLDPSAGTRLNLALCEEHERRLAAAWAHFRGVIEALPDADPRRTMAVAHETSLSPRVPRLRVTVPADAPPLTITLDGLALMGASIGVDLPVDPGPHALVVRTSVGQTVRSVVAAEGETLAIQVSLPIAPPPPDDPPAGVQLRAHTSGQRTAGFVVGAMGAAGVIASVVLGGLVLEDKATVSRNCQGVHCNAAGLAAGRDGSHLAMASTVSFALGLVGIGGGTALVLSTPGPVTPRDKGTFVGLRGSF